MAVLQSKQLGRLRALLQVFTADSCVDILAQATRVGCRFLDAQMHCQTAYHPILGSGSGQDLLDPPGEVK